MKNPPLNYSTVWYTIDKSTQSSVKSWSFLERLKIVFQFKLVLRQITRIDLYLAFARRHFAVIWMLERLNYGLFYLNHSYCTRNVDHRFLIFFPALLAIRKHPTRMARSKACYTFGRDVLVIIVYPFRKCVSCIVYTV